MNRTASNYLNVDEKVRKIRKIRKIRKLKEVGTYGADIVRYIPETLELVFQGMLEDIDTKEQPGHLSYRGIENLDFQILLTDNYYTNPNSMHAFR